MEVTESVGPLRGDGEYSLAEAGRTGRVAVAAVDQELAVKGSLQSADLPCHRGRIQARFASEGLQGGKSGGFKEPQ
ncbi:hypothetical protein ABH941_000871 [Streptacidiphilus sp. EB103A]